MNRNQNLFRRGEYDYDATFWGVTINAAFVAFVHVFSSYGSWNGDAAACPKKGHEPFLEFSVRLLSSVYGRVPMLIVDDVTTSHMTHIHCIGQHVNRVDEG